MQLPEKPCIFVSTVFRTHFGTMTLLKSPLPASRAAVSTVSCSELLLQIANGDRRAFKELYDTYGGKLFAICLRMMGSRSEAEDVYQDAFVKIWEKSWQYDPAKGEGLGWLATITRNTALDRLRARPKSHVSLSDDTTEEIDRKVSTSLPDSIGEHGTLARCLAGMRDEYRNAVVLTYMNGLTHEELAAQFGKPLGTVKSWVARGLAQLKECMNQ